MGHSRNCEPGCAPASTPATRANEIFARPSEPLPDALMERRRACGYSYYATMGVERSDREGRAWIARKNFELFGAPHELRVLTRNILSRS